MPRVVLTPDLNPATVSKTIEHNTPHTATHLNTIIKRVIGGSRVLYGLSIVQTGVGTIDLMPGAFVANGVIVTLKEKISLTYESILGDGLLPNSAGRNQSIVLWAYCEDAAATSAVTFGLTSEEDIDDLAGDLIVVIALRQSADDLDSDSDAGRWSRVYGFSNEDLARDLREGVQSLTAYPFQSDSGLRLTTPPIPKAYFQRDEQLLVFADRFLLPSFRMYGTEPNYGRLDVRAIREQGVDPEAFDYAGKYNNPYDLLSAKWGFVVSRDIGWHEVYVPGASGAADVAIPNARAYLMGSHRLVIFENGLPLAPAEVTEVDENTINVAWISGSVYDFVYFNDIVFRETHSLSQTDLDQSIGGPQDYDFVLKDHLVDTARHTVLTFVRVTSPGSAVADGGYFQLGRIGTATRGSQAFKATGGTQLVDSGTVRLRGVEMGVGTVTTVTLLCIRGSSGVAVGEAAQASMTPFHARFQAKGSGPGTDEIQALPDLLGFIYELPSVETVKVAVHNMDGFVTEDGTTLASGHFVKYILEQGPDFETEGGIGKTPRNISASAAPTWGVPGPFSRLYAMVTLTVDGGAPAAAAGDPVRLRAGRLIDNLPKYPVGQKKLRVTVDREQLVSGVDFDEVTDQSIVLHVPVLPDQYVEVWVE